MWSRSNRLPLFWWLMSRHSQPHRYVCPLVMTLSILWYRWAKRKDVGWYPATKGQSGKWRGLAGAVEVFPASGCAISLRSALPLWCIKAECWVWNFLKQRKWGAGLLDRLQPGQHEWSFE